MADEKIIDRVRKLLAKAEGTDNENEAAVFLDAALKMMARHALDEAMVRAGNHEAPEEIIEWRWVVKGLPNHNLSRVTAAYNVAHVLGCEGVISRNQDGMMTQRFASAGVEEVATLHLFGTTSAIEQAQLLIASLSLQWDAAAEKAAIEAYPEPVVGYGTRSPLSPPGGEYDYSYRDYVNSYNDILDRMTRDGAVSSNSWRQVFNSSSRYGVTVNPPNRQKARARFTDSYVIGYSHRVVERLTGTQEAVQAEVPGAALVHLDDAARAKAAAEAAFPNAGSGQSISHDMTGYSYGKAAGGSADLGGSNLGNQRGRELEA